MFEFGIHVHAEQIVFNGVTDEDMAALVRLMDKRLLDRKAFSECAKCSDALKTIASGVRE